VLREGLMPPRILTRPEHTVSRKNIDPDALQVLYRLKKRGCYAYLVGGGVRDLLLARTPKDFDVATNAHPQEIKRLFRNCFVVGRRFRLCHVHFGRKIVEVSTFRRQAAPEEGDTLIRRDNTFGTPEEDAFRRDFTVNALFYDVATFSIIDYVGGLDDLKARLIRTIGDPEVRFREDPVRMIRAVALAARLGFAIDRASLEAIRALRGEIHRSSPARILEEVYKILRQGASRETFRLLHEVGLLAHLFPEANAALAGDGEHLLGSLQRLDGYRGSYGVVADDLTNPIVMGSLLVPLGLPLERMAPLAGGTEEPDEEGVEEPSRVEDARVSAAPVGEKGRAPKAAVTTMLPFARRDIERLRHMLAAQRRLHEVGSSRHAKLSLIAKTYFEEALRWLEIHGGVEGQELAAYWRSADIGDVAAPDAAPAPEGRSEAAPPRRRRRRRRRRPKAKAPSAG
jgi:poly(A) polymerase